MKGRRQRKCKGRGRDAEEGLKKEGKEDAPSVAGGTERGRERWRSRSGFASTTSDGRKSDLPKKKKKMLIGHVRMNFQRVFVSV